MKDLWQEWSTGRTIFVKPSIIIIIIIIIYLLTNS